MIIYDNTGAVLLDIEVDDTSVRYKAIKGENSLTLKFSLDEHIEVPLGAYCSFKDEIYSLMLPEDLTMNHRRSFEYTLVMYSEDAKAKRYKFVNPVDGRLKFPLTAKPIEHLQMFVDNMNMRDSGWEAGECPDGVEILLSYNHTSCHDALVQLADELELDYWFNGKTVNLGKLELNKDNPLPLSYGGDGEGLKPNVKRGNYSDALPIEVLYIQGSSQNIDASKYGSQELHLPKGQTIGFDGTYFEDEDGFDAGKARYYMANSNGYSVSRSDKAVVNHSEDSLDCSDIYPTKEEKILNVIEADKEKHFYDILFKSDVDYSKYVIEGEVATVVFQSGMLAGKEFDLATDSNGKLICEKEGEYWRVEIVPQDIDGITMPDDATHFLPAVNDTFKVFGIQLPQEYIANNDTKSGAEWDMFRYAVKHLYANEDAQYSISGELDEIYAKRNWTGIKDRLVLGSYVSFRDKSFQAEPLLIRIIGIKEYVNKPYSPILEISNATLTGTIVGAINRVENKEAETDDKFSKNRQFTKRRFSSVQQTLSMLQAAFDEFSPGIDPVTVHTMTLVAGDPRGQFVFTASRQSIDPIPCPVYYDAATKQMKVDACALVHMTLGIDGLTAPGVRTAGDYFSWNVKADESEVLDEGDISYYVCIKAKKDGTDAELFLTPDPVDLEVDGYYYFYVGVLNSESGGTRDFATIYGFTEVAPGRIVTNVIRSADGNTYFDLVNGIISGKISFKAGSTGLEELQEFMDLKVLAGTANSNATNAQNKASTAISVADKAQQSADTANTNALQAGEVAGIASEKAEEAIGKANAAQEGLDNMEVGGQNLLRNSGFTGDYLSEQLADESVLESATELYSAPFDHWTVNNAIVQDSSESASGKEASLTDGRIAQTFSYNLVANESYVVSFKAKGVSLQVNVGGFRSTIVLTDEWSKYEETFTATTKPVTFVISNATCTLCDLKFERGNKSTSWSTSQLDNASDRAYYQALKYLSTAIKDGSTDFLGGLVLTNVLLLKNALSEVTAGANGVTTDSEDDVAFWAGGTLTQATDTMMKYLEDPTYQPTDEEVASMSKAVITHGGRAILNDIILRGAVYSKAGKIGKLRITEDGIEITTEQGGRVEIIPQGIILYGYDGNISGSLGYCGGSAISAVGRGGIGACPEVDEKVGVYASSAKSAFFCNKGRFVGLRTSTKVISESGSSNERNEIDELDTNVLVNMTSGLCYINILNTISNNGIEDGQEYIIETMGASLNITTGSDNIFSMYSGRYFGSASNPLTHTTRDVLRFKYYADAAIWTCTAISKTA